VREGSKIFVGFENFVGFVNAKTIPFLNVSAKTKISKKIQNSLSKIIKYLYINVFYNVFFSSKEYKWFMFFVKTSV